jgi:hypothetical protein
VTISLKVAVEGLSILADLNLSNVQVYPSKEWNLRAYGEDTNDGWCSTRELSIKLEQISYQ